MELTLTVHLFLSFKKKGLMMCYCEMVHHIVTHSECSDFVIHQFGLSADQKRVFFFVGHLKANVQHKLIRKITK